jgi:hypothetical protein
VQPATRHRDDSHAVSYTTRRDVTTLYLQKLSSGTWRTVDHSSTGKRAKAVFQETAKRARSWRVIFKGKKTIWACVSAVTKR